MPQGNYYSAEIAPGVPVFYSAGSSSTAGKIFRVNIHIFQGDRG